MAQETNKEIKVGETYDVALDSRGAMGLQLQHKSEPADIVSVERIESRPHENVQAGDAVKAVFRIKAMQAGSTTVTFFETQPWDKEFPPIIRERVQVKVGE